jgi:hypothetical protein
MWVQMVTHVDPALPVEEHRPDDVHLATKTIVSLFIQIFSEGQTLLTIETIGPFWPIISEKFCFTRQPTDDATVLL